MFIKGGDVLEDTNVAQSLVRTGTTVVSSEEWEACNRDRFYVNILEDGKFVEIVHVNMCMFKHIQYSSN